MAKKKVAFQGERGAFSEAAARQKLGTSIKPVACESFDQLFETVEKNKANIGIIPIENSLIGSIHVNYDLLLEYNLCVIGETQHRIEHCLIAKPGVSIKKLSKVYSHPAALQQCRDFFKKHPHLEPVSYYDTAGSVKMVSESDLNDIAGIASPYAAELYGMKKIKKSIEDTRLNYTRFLLLAKKPSGYSKNAKTSIVFSIKSKPGLLFKALSVFALRDINLTKIESRPVRKEMWRYYFYVDFEGHIREKHVKRALEHLREITTFVKILGSYPIGVNSK